MSPALFTICLGMSVAGIHMVQADTWDGGGDGVSFEDAFNWDTDLAPNAVANTLSDINGAFTVDRDVVSNPGRAFVQGGAVLNVHGGGTHSDGQAGSTVRDFVGNGSTGTVNVYGAGTVWDVGHVLAIAHSNNSDGTVKVYDGATYNGGRGSNSLVGGYGAPFDRGHTLSIGGNAANNGMTGLFEISSNATMKTRTGVAVANNGTFSVVGSGGSILLGGANTDAGWFLVSSNGTWKATVDLGGITPIFVEKQTNTSTLNPTAEFQAGALLDVGFINTAPISGTWTLLEVEGAPIVGGELLAFAPGVDTSVWSFNVDNSGANGVLTVTAATSTPKLTWNGTPNGNWDIGTTSNWLAGATPASYPEPAQVTFDDSLAGTSTVNLTTTLSPVTLDMSNAVTNYTFSGTGKISGTTGLTKNGAGSLTLANSGGNDFTGPVQINAGTITLGSANALGDTSGALNVDGGTLDLGGFSVTKGTVNIANSTINNGTLTGTSFTAQAATINAALAGASASLTKSGSGTVILAGANTYDGSTTISAGTVQLGSATALGSTTGTTALISGATLDLNGHTIAETFTQIDGPVVNSNTTTAAEITAEMVDLGNPTFDGPGDITISNIRRTNGVTRRITKNGAGTLTLAGDVSNNRYGLTVNDGDVILAKTSGEAISRFELILNNASSTVTLQDRGDQLVDSSDILHKINAGTLDLNGFNEQISALGTSNGTEPGGIVTNSDAEVFSVLTLSGDGNTPTATFPGQITGDLDLVKAGSNIQTLTGANTYTGNTTVNGGTLALDGASLTSELTVVNPGASLGLTVGSPASTTGEVDFVDGTSTVTLTGSPSATTLMTASSFTGVTPVLSPAVPGWGLEVSGGNLNLVVAASDYDTWAALYSPEDLTDTAGDNDNDGLTNQQEYAFGLNPVSGSSVNPYLAADLTGGAFTYKRRKTTGLTYTIEVSEDLDVWKTDDTATQFPTDIGGGNESVLVTPTGPLPTPKAFVRVKAQ